MSPQPSKKGVRQLGYPGLLLGTAVLLATSLLAMGHVSTREAIADRLAEDLKASLGQVLPASMHDNDLLSAPLQIPRSQDPSTTVYRAQKGRHMTGVAYRVTAPDGYGGPIELLLGVDPQGRLLGVRVLSHSETPGLGDKMEIAKSDWIRGFKGLSQTHPPSDAWSVKKDGGQFDQFTGATITPRAVVKAVKKGLVFFADHRHALLEPDDIALDPKTTKPTATVEAPNNLKPTGGS